MVGDSSADFNEHSAWPGGGFGMDVGMDGGDAEEGEHQFFGVFGEDPFYNSCK